MAATGHAYGMARAAPGISLLAFAFTAEAGLYLPTQEGWKAKLAQIIG